MQHSAHRLSNLVSLFFLLFVTLFAGSSRADDTFLGLKVPPQSEGLSEGPTDFRTNLKPIGVVRAVMLFALFPDTTQHEDPQELYNRLVPGAQAFFTRTSYGRMQLKVDIVSRWIPMAHPTTWPGYDCSRFESQRDYLAEAIGKAQPQVDFLNYDIVYVVGSLGAGLPNSPTFIAQVGNGIKAGEKEVRLGVTFGRDCRGANWGWQTLSHETGHICGLPDLYLFGVSADPYKNIHTAVGFWDIMGFQAVGSPYLAWQRRKLNWLDDNDFGLIAKGSRPITLWIEPIDRRSGKHVAAISIPVSDTEAIVCEVRPRDPGDNDPKSTGLLVYRVSVTAASGHGPIHVIPAAPDDLNPASERKYITLYNALYTGKDRIAIKEDSVIIELTGARRPDGSLQLRVARK